jgi:hypothetical protein
MIAGGYVMPLRSRIVLFAVAVLAVRHQRQPRRQPWDISMAVAPKSDFVMEEG